MQQLIDLTRTCSWGLFLQSPKCACSISGDLTALLCHRRSEIIAQDFAQLVFDQTHQRR